MSFSELGMSESESIAADTISTRSVTSYQSSRSGLTRQGTGSSTTHFTVVYYPRVSVQWLLSSCCTPACRLHLQTTKRGEETWEGQIKEKAGYGHRNTKTHTERTGYVSY